MIPAEKNAGVARALRETFDVTEFDDIRRVTKGLSSDLVFRIVVKGSATAAISQSLQLRNRA